MAKISRDIYDSTKFQDKVVFQEKKLPLTCEFNLFEDIYNYRGIDLTQLSINNNYYGDSFKVISSPLDNQIIIKQGTFYHLGRPIQLYSDIIITNLSTPITDRTDTVFVEWYIEEIGALQDPTIVDSILKFETTRQYRINLTISVIEDSDLPAPTSGNNYFVIAKLNRLAGNEFITTDMIEDERVKIVYTFVSRGCYVEDLGGLSVSISEGSNFVAGNEFVTEDTVLSLAPSVTSYVYVEKVSGYVEVSTLEPLDYHLMLAEVSTSATDIISITDKRMFKPITWRNKYENTDNGNFTFIEKYNAGENLSKGDVVYISSSRTVKKSFANLGTLPCIGIAPKNISMGVTDNIIVLGNVNNDSWNWIPGELLYLDIISGGITQIPPTILNSYMQRIGIAITDTLIYFNPDRIYIKVNNIYDTTIELMNDGGLETSPDNRMIDIERLSFLDSEVDDPADTSFTIKAGNYYITDTECLSLPDTLINMGVGGNFETSAITNPNWFNKAIFTLRDDLQVQKYESIAQSSSGAVDNPSIPYNELPVVLVIYQDDSSGLAGTILPIAEDNILDLRNFLNMGNEDNVAFKPIYKNSNTFIIQKGSIWVNTNAVGSTDLSMFEKMYLTLSTNLNIVGDTSTDNVYYIYMDYNSATGGITSSSFVTMIEGLDLTDLREYIPLGQYTVVDGAISRNSFISFGSRFWHYRNVKNEDIFITPTLGQTIFNTSFNFLNSDYLDVSIGGFKFYEINDYIKIPPNTVTFNYIIKKNAAVRINKV